MISNLINRNLLKKYTDLNFKQIFFGIQIDYMNWFQ